MNTNGRIGLSMRSVRGKFVAVGLILACAALSAIAPPAHAQASPPAPPGPPGLSDTNRLIPDRKLFRKSDLLFLAGFTGATVALFPLDRQLATTVRDSGLITNRTLEETAKVIGFLGSPGPFLLGGVMYAVGRYADKPRVAHLAVHSVESIVVGMSVATILKTTLGRARPFITADTNPRDFVLGRGFRSGSYQSFPSGHSTTAFAVAASATAEVNEWWPRATWIVGPVLYSGATLVGLSRMYEDKHWASDVVMGAAIGIFAGLKTVRFNHTRAGNRLDRLLLGSDHEPGLQFRVTPASEGSILLSASARW